MNWWMAIIFSGIGAIIGTAATITYSYLTRIHGTCTIDTSDPGKNVLQFGGFDMDDLYTKKYLELRIWFKDIR